jgi:hypothetical protein
MTPQVQFPKVVILSSNEVKPVANKKLYADADKYEGKLARVMDRLGVTDYTFDWGRWGAVVQFTYKGGQYRFEHSVDNARSHDQKITWGSDCFAQIVRTLEDLARMVERGIYDLQVWVAGMKMLPAAKEIPSFFVRLGFAAIPESEAAVEEKFKTLAKVVHPDQGGDSEEMKALIEAREQAKQWFGNGKS